MSHIPQSTLDKMAKTVKQFLDEGRMFTGYDVTIETRTRERMHLRHQDVREDVHEIEELLDAVEFGHDGPNGQTVRWKKSQVNMPGTNPGWVFVYHRDYLDPNTYVPSQRGGTQPTVAAPQPVNSLSVVNDGTATDSGGEADDGTFSTDYRNRLLVPARFLKEAGIVAGDTVYVVPNSVNKTVMVVKDSSGFQSGGMKVTTMTVERDCELRISSTTLKAADLTDNKFVIETTDKTVNNTTKKVVEVKGS